MRSTHPCQPAQDVLQRTAPIVAQHPARDHLSLHRRILQQMLSASTRDHHLLNGVPFQQRLRFHRLAEHTQHRQHTKSVQHNQKTELLSAAHYLCAAYSLRFNNLQSSIFNLQSSIVSLPGRSSGSPQPVIPSRRVVVSGVILTSSFNFQNLRSPIFNFQSSISKNWGITAAGTAPESHRIPSRQDSIHCLTARHFYFLFFILLFFYFSKDLAFMPFTAAKLQSFLLFFAFFIFFILFQFSIFIFFSGSKFFTLHSSLFIFFSLH